MQGSWTVVPCGSAISGRRVDVDGDLHPPLASPRSSTGYPLVGLDVAGPGAPDDLSGRSGAGGLRSHSAGIEPLPHVLLVERRDVRAGNPFVSGPIAGRVRGEHLVDQQQLAVGETELELGVGQDDAFGGRVLRRPEVDVDRPASGAPRSRSSPRISPVWDSVMFSSWPVVALVAGVNIGSGSRSARRSPAVGARSWGRRLPGIPSRMSRTGSPGQRIPPGSPPPAHHHRPPGQLTMSPRRARAPRLSSVPTKWLGVLEVVEEMQAEPGEDACPCQGSAVRGSRRRRRSVRCHEQEVGPGRSHRSPGLCPRPHGAAPPCGGRVVLATCPSLDCHARVRAEDRGVVARRGRFCQGARSRIGRQRSHGSWSPWR